MAIREEPLRQFVGWANEYVTGDEKGQAQIDRGEPVTPPGVPSDYPKPNKLVTADCIQP